VSSCRAAYSESICALLVDNPFFYHWTQQLIYKETTTVDTVAVAYDEIGESGRILVNPDYFKEEMPLNQRVTLIEHELLHWIYSHPMLVESRLDNYNFNIACDLAINSLLNFQKKDLPAGAITPKSIAALISAAIGAPVIPPPEKSSSTQYYEWIKMLSKLVPPKDGEAGGTSEGTKGKSKNSNGKSPKEILKDLAEQIDHKHWGSADPQAVEHAQQRLAQDMGEARERLTDEEWAKCSGGIAGQIEEIFKAAKKGEVPWQQKLKKFAGFCGAVALRATYSQLNKYGMPPKIKSLPGTKLLVCIDTSGSMSTKELQDVLAEVESLSRTGVSIDLMEFDYEVHRVTKFKKRKDYKLIGRGGTSFVTPFKWLKANFKQKKYSGCVVLTDGYEEFPGKDLMVVKTLLILTNNNATVPKHCGQVIRLKREN
jgi:predicted metal-dependent peptidase